MMNNGIGYRRHCLPGQSTLLTRAVFLLALISVACSVAGQTFKIQRNTAFTAEDLESITWSDRAMFVGCADEQVYTSTDNGQTWKKAELKRVDGDVAAILCTSDGTVIAGVNTYDEHFIAISSDLGATWKRVWSDDDITINLLIELDQGIVIAAGDEPVLVKSGSSVKYQSWKSIPRPWVTMGEAFAEIDVHDFHRFSNGDLLLVGESAFTICYDRGFGTMQFACPKLNEPVRFTSVAFMNDAEGCAGSENGAIFRTSDRGKTWKQVYFGKTHIGDIAMNSTGQGVAVGTEGLILYTYDAGNTWTIAESNIQKELTFVKLMKDGRFVAGGEDGFWMYIQY
jgi:photosystem II stability/assembly factor-like uncharacterized protein